MYQYKKRTFFIKKNSIMMQILLRIISGDHFCGDDSKDFLLPHPFQIIIQMAHQNLEVLCSFLSNIIKDLFQNYYGCGRSNVHFSLKKKIFAHGRSLFGRSFCGTPFEILILRIPGCEAGLVATFWRLHSEDSILQPILSTRLPPSKYGWCSGCF